MANYSMSQVEVLTGIKSHTLRKWEERYQFIRPKRTDTNIRYYTDDMLRLLLNVAILVRHGYRMQQIDQLAESEIYDQVTQLLAEEVNDHQDTIDLLIGYLLNYQEHEFSALLDQVVQEKGMEHAFIHIVYPFLRQVGLFWGTSKIIPAQEHFVSNLVRQKLIAAIDNVPAPKIQANKMHLFLPEGEWHELGLLLANYIAKSKGLNTFYLGQSVPLTNVQLAMESQNSKIAFTMVTAPRGDSIADDLNALAKALEAKILLSGPQSLSGEIAGKSGLQYIAGPEEFIQVISKMK